MKYPIFTIRDHLEGFSPQLFASPNEQSAARGFAFMVSNNKNVMGFRPSNYDLYKIGEFDEESGIFEPEIAVKFICNGGSVNEKSESESE